jgi:nucleoside triphosphate pyrophosphatase
MKIILASQSPRRYDLLKMIGLDFEVKPSNIIEMNHDELPPLEYAMFNAKEKAKVVAEQYPDSMIISADTIVIHDNHILEKPEDESNAYEIINKLNGNEHQVITAFGIVIKNQNIWNFDYETTQVIFRNLSSDKIKEYIETGESLDKAGGYGAQGMGSLLIERVEGCFYNVVGFPLGKFYVMYENILIELMDKK